MPIRLVIEILVNRSKEIQSLSALASVIALIGGGLYGIHQYNAKVKEDRVREVFTFLAKKDQPPLVEAWREINSKYNTAFKQIKPISSEPKSEDRDRRYCDIVRGVIDSPSMQTHFDSIIEFYETLDICITTGLCDRDTARSFFKKDATNLGQAFFCYIQHRREETKDSEYAISLDRIAEMK